MEDPRKLLSRVAPEVPAEHHEALAKALEVARGQAIAALAHRLRKCSGDADRQRLLDLVVKATGSGEK